MVVFQAADIYGQDLFSRFLRIRPLALAWSVAFLLLLVRPLVPLILQRLAMHWSGARLVSRGVGCSARWYWARQRAASCWRNSCARTPICAAA